MIRNLDAEAPWPKCTWGRGDIWSAIPWPVVCATSSRWRNAPPGPTRAGASRTIRQTCARPSTGSRPVSGAGWIRLTPCILWGLFRHPVARPGGRAVRSILGDAAHPTLPFLAQGANLALEDAWVLAAALDGRTTCRMRWRVIRRFASNGWTGPRTVDAATKNAQNYHISFPPSAVCGPHGAASFGPGFALTRFWAGSTGFIGTMSPAPRSDLIAWQAFVFQSRHGSDERRLSRPHRGG